MSDPIGAIAKTPTELKRSSISYDGWLDTGENITGVTFKVTGAGSLVTISGSLINADKRGVTFFVGGGDDGETYEVVVEVTTDGGQVKDACLVVTVADC